MTWFKDGTHDRVFNGMLAGACAVTDSSGYMEEEFCGFWPDDPFLQKAGESEVAFFRLTEIEKLPDMIRSMLDHPEEMQMLADRGYEKAHQMHTWDARARELDRDLFPYLGG